jgi:NADPH-dependent 2,4-dienoyl-CoA reductase/sulfur reductase-like enzyme
VALVVVGASLAGLRAVEGARKAGYDGRLVLIGAERHLPYDRPPLSKAFLAAGPEPSAPTYRVAEELAALGVELRLGAPATGLDTARREVALGEERVPYDALVVATGARPRRLPGDDLEGVHVLRTLDDARAVRRALDAGARTVVVGAGFIGSEVASAARERGLPVTVVEAAPAPLLRAVGPQAAPLCAALHARAGVDLRCGSGVEALERDQDRVTGVRLADGTRLPADLVVVGAGCTPVTDWLDGSGLALDDGVVCDATLQASAPRVLAAGDIARVEGTRLEHWTSAAEQGTRAGANAAALLTGGALLPYGGVPYFWSDAYGSKLQMVGHPSDEPAEVVGDPDGPWLVLYRRGEHLSGVLSLDLPGRIMKFRALLARGAGFAEGLELARSRPLVAVA